MLVVVVVIVAVVVVTVVVVVVVVVVAAAVWIVLVAPGKSFSECDNQLLSEVRLTSKQRSCFFDAETPLPSFSLEITDQNDYI